MKVLAYSKLQILLEINFDRIITKKKSKSQWSCSNRLNLFIPLDVHESDVSAASGALKWEQAVFLGTSNSRKSLDQSAVNTVFQQSKWVKASVRANVRLLVIDMFINKKRCRNSYIGYRPPESSGLHLQRSFSPDVCFLCDSVMHIHAPVATVLIL